MPTRGDDAGPQFAFRKITPVVKAMLIVVGVFFAFELFDDHGWVGTHAVIARWLSILPGTVTHGQVWRLFTYPLVNPVGGDVMPVVWGALVLYFFGPDLEDLFGRSRFLVLCGAMVVVSSLAAVVLGLAFRSLDVPIFGLALPTSALTGAWGARFPNRRLLFPPVSGKWLVVAIAAFQVVLFIAKASGNPAASLVAIGIGWLLGKSWDRVDDLLDRLRLRRAHARRDRTLRAIRGGLAEPNPKKRPVDKRFLN